MEPVWKFLHNPDVWIALAIGVGAAWVATPLLKFAKAALLWPPRRLGRGFLGLLKDASGMTKASKEPTAGIVYVGYNLALLIVNVALVLLIVGLIATFQIMDPGWAYPFHKLGYYVACIALFVFAYAVLKRFLFILLVYTAVFNPPKPAPLKVGNLEFKPGALGFLARAATETPPAEVTNPAAEQQDKPGT